MFLTRSTSTTEQARVWLAPTRHKVVHLALLIQIVFVSALRVCKMFDILEPPAGAMLGYSAGLQCLTHVTAGGQCCSHRHTRPGSFVGSLVGSLGFLSGTRTTTVPLYFPPDNPLPSPPRLRLVLNGPSRHVPFDLFQHTPSCERPGQAHHAKIPFLKQSVPSTGRAMQLSPKPPKHDLGTQLAVMSAHA
jgi:hypothetical protein